MASGRYSNLLKRYERYAPNYDQQFARYSEGTLTKALELTPNINGRLLDVACGTGSFEELLRAQRPHLSLTGVDISSEMLARARERFRDDDQVEFLSGTAEHVPVGDAAFDIVTCNNAFHLVQNAGSALREFHRVLKPDGTIIIIDWCRDAPQMALMAVALRLTDRQVRSIRTLGSMTALVEEHGFEITVAERFRVKPMWGLMAVAAKRIASTTTADATMRP